MTRRAEPDSAKGPLAARPSPSDTNRFAAELHGFGPTGIAALLGIVTAQMLFAPLGAVLALVWAKRSGTPWQALGLSRPSSWVRTIVVGVVFGILFKILMKSIVMPILGADPINAAYHHLAGNRAALPGAIFAMLFVAGFGEETFYRGYLFERLGRVLGRSASAQAFIVVLTSALFGAVHWGEQGIAGVQQATLVGLVFGTIVARSGRIWMPMIAHAAFDLTALAIIYWDLETAVARSILR